MSEPSKNSEDGFSHMPRLPFVSILLVYTFGGCVFVAFNVPLLVAYFSGCCEYATFPNLMQGAIVDPWNYVLFSAPQVSLAFGAAFFSLVLGLVVKPVDQAHAQFWTFVVARSAKHFKRTSHIESRLFRPSKYAASEFSKQVAWLMRNQSARAHWEYELLLYIAHWSLAFNVLAFWLLCTLHLGIRGQVLMNVILLVSWIISVGFALAKALVMGDTHNFYIVEAVREKTNSGASKG